MDVKLNDKVVCPTCRGNKEVRGMGGLQKICPKCAGKGQIDKLDIPKPESKLVAVTADALINADLPKVIEETKKVKEEKPKIEAVKESVQTEESLGEMMGYTPFMVEAMLNEPRMNPEKWREKYSAILSNPLAIMSDLNKQVLPDSKSRANFREIVAKNKKPAPRKYNMMKAQNIAGELEGIE